MPLPGSLCALDSTRANALPPCDAHVDPSVPLALPRLTELLSAAAPTKGGYAVIDVARYEGAEDTVAGAADSVLRTLRSAGEVYAVSKPAFVLIGATTASMATIAFEGEGGSGETSVAVYVFAGSGCFYVVRVSAAGDDNTADVEKALLERVSISVAKPSSEEQPSGGLWVVAVTAVIAAAVVLLALLMRQRRRRALIAQDIDYWIDRRQ